MNFTLQSGCPAFRDELVTRLHNDGPAGLAALARLGGACSRLWNASEARWSAWFCGVRPPPFRSKHSADAPDAMHEAFSHCSRFFASRAMNTMDAEQHTTVCGWVNRVPPQSQSGG